MEDWGRFPRPKVRKKQHKTKPSFVLRKKTGSEVSTPGVRAYFAKAFYDA